MNPWFPPCWLWDRLMSSLAPPPRILSSRAKKCRNVLVRLAVVRPPAGRGHGCRGCSAGLWGHGAALLLARGGPPRPTQARSSSDRLKSRMQFQILVRKHADDDPPARPILHLLLAVVEGRSRRDHVDQHPMSRSAESSSHYGPMQSRRNAAQNQLCLSSAR